MSADELKAEGNKLFAAKDFNGAVEKFSAAIEVDPSNHVLYSNRSGAYASLRDFNKALTDAEKCTEIKPDWSKGWSRKGAACHGQGDLLGATDSYEKALEIDPNNAQAKSGQEAVKRAIEAEAREDGVTGDPTGGLGSMFNDPAMIQKLAANPKTSSLLGDSSFMQKLNDVKANPNKIGEMMGDPRFLSVMSVLLGIDMNFGGPGDFADKNSNEKKEVEEDSPMPDAPKPQESKSTPAPAPEPEEPEPEDEEAAAAKKAKEEADAEKALGTASYKKRQFDDSIAHYSKAWELHKDITYLTNLSAAYFEKGDYDQAITACRQAIEHGREVLADFKIIAKAFGRIGSSYEKQGDLKSAIDNYQRSLTEHRTPDILAKLRAAEKAQVIKERESYIDPQKAEEARELGNQKFKDADWAGAVEAYSEMVKRAPEDPRGYSNRAACFIKLLAFPSAVTDCDVAIAKDPKFIRAYLRKAQALFAMREYNKCIDVCALASTVDAAELGGKNAREIDAQSQKALQAQFAAREGETEEQAMQRIQNDPEIAGILQDPVMQSILQQAKGDPAALQEHMRNPGIKTQIQKLIAAGVIRVGR